jgi:bifunctional ADP-heptose synthase (sugar kinase/adenylyltransferase)
MSGKILTLGEALARRQALRDQGKVLVQAHGKFDLLQPVHIQRLKAARAHGDVLLVTVVGVRAQAVCLLDQELRARTLAALDDVDLVVPLEDVSGADAIRELSPEVFVQNVDLGWAGRTTQERAEREAAIEVTARYFVLDQIVRHSRPEEDALSPEAERFLRDFRTRYTASSVIARLSELKGLKVLVLGDAIIDEYHFCRPYGMPLKSPVIAAQFLNGESHAGGVLAVANHVAGFCDDVHLLTVLGALAPREDFVRSRLRPNVNVDLFLRPDAPTIVKRRYLRQFLTQKLFEISFSMLLES